jgi:hypothetical protein
MTAHVRLRVVTYGPSFITGTRIVSREPIDCPLTEDAMATKLDKTIKRELEHQGKLYTVTIAPDGVKVVEKGKRNGPHVSWSSIINGDTALNENLNISNDATRRDH